MFLNPAIAAPNLARHNLLSEPSNQFHMSPSKPNALFKAVLVSSEACLNSGARSIFVWYAELLKASSRLCKCGQSPDENDSEKEIIHVFDDRCQAKVPMCFNSGLKVMTHVSLLSSDRTQNGTHYDISSSSRFPVSKTVDKRLLANTSGETSTNM